MKPIRHLFRRHQKHTYNHRGSVMRRISLAADRIIRATAAEYHLSFIGAVDLICEKAPENGRREGDGKA